MESEKQVFDSEILVEDIQKILTALNKCSDETLKKILGDTFNE